VLARARKVVLKDWQRFARPRSAQQGKTGAASSCALWNALSSADEQYPEQLP
jgi:hypothetical protein